ncbi:hypothetical protein U732_2941 [Clostridium argentinense CDC 2741]|uniref:Uncharacterized protein n=1 Tax=Clostridium argentinense CDC 2741 TaxID=1418104 RepID=A0A0C1R232_9CLOT|nr:hypothetical protein [Clostridium argentinense]ARC84547.1 hypothetical protein RSJ17_08390 [Clostridium argentinense]KIE47482.1 hypothetical protein U732_2941 [Clostridium argentinense CDC 2741]NFF38671.1 hypothetical protein [Clostridium argentinense]NFP48896.1 hypothetical protein [Clostridium argentinense]NFP72956.1 hypothetical protein [Clostridium argentinense]
MQGRIKVLKDVDKSNILPMTHAKAVYVDEKNTLDKTLNNIESQIIQQRKTYAELKELIENNKLIPGTQYVLIDYKTKYQQPTTNVIKEMDVEELVLAANSDNTFKPIVSSLKYPQDIVYYDFDNNICEDNTTYRNGFILRRYDPISGNDAPQDWRTMLWARYKPNKDKYLNGTLGTLNYNSWTSGSAQMNVIYKADNKLWMAKNANVPTSPTDPNVFFEVYPDLDTPLLIEERTKWGDDIELMRGELVEVPTFGERCINNTIKNVLLPDSGIIRLHNNVFIKSCNDNLIGDISYNNTLDGSRNSLGSFCISNIFVRASSCNNLGVQCQNNILGITCTYNSFGGYCTGNILLNNNQHNSFGIRCYDNILTNFCLRNSFGNLCFRNKFSDSCQLNLFGNGCSNNVFKSSCGSNTFGSSTQRNVFGISCNYNNFGNFSADNIFGNSCGYNTFGNYTNKNTFGDNCQNNTFFNSCGNNTFGDSFQYNVVKALVNKNVTSLETGFRNTVTMNIEHGSGSYIYWYGGGAAITVKTIP